MKFGIFNQRWRPYLTGALAGILAIVSIVATTVIIEKTNFLGASTTFVRAAGFIERVVAPGYVESNEYFAGRGVKVDWQFMLVVGIFLGALSSSLLGRSFKFESIPPLWQERFKKSISWRGFWAFLGGVVAMIGARLASGCPSGHGLSGLMQLSVSGFVALIMFFGVGALTANIIYRRRKV